MRKCPDTDGGINCNYVGCCPYGEVCLSEDDDDSEDNEVKNK